MKTNKLLLLILSITFLHGCDAQTNPTMEKQVYNYTLDYPKHIEEVKKSDAEWKAQLSPEAYDVLRHEGTERAFTGKYWDFKGKGIYCCAGCQLPLFDSETKFKSGTGWPSFYTTVNSSYVGEVEDSRYGMMRTEVICNRCQGHLGHVFPDGPQPTGLRYCINSVSLQFVEIDN